MHRVFVPLTRDAHGAFRRRPRVETVELRQVATFLAIAEERHFGRAAARLRLAQSSVSLQLQQLERRVGVRLVQRTSHEVRLTAAGEAFEAEARRLVAQAERAVTRARAVDAGRAGTLNIGFNYVARHWVLPPTMRVLRQDCPDLVLNLTEMMTGAQLTGLATGTLDVGLVFGRPLRPGLHAHRIFELPLVAMVAEHHRWAGSGSVGFAALAEEQCVLFSRDRSPAMYDAVVHTAEQAGIRLTVAEEVDDPSATALMVRSHNLVAFASAGRTMRSLPEGLTAVGLVDPTPMLNLYATWRSDTDNGAVAAFRDGLLKAGPHEWTRSDTS